jgi:type I restriction enzyme M protein
LLGRDGDDLFDHYRHALEKLGQEKGTLGLIFAKAQNKFQDPAKLRRVIVDLIDAETWTVLGADVKGDAYEGLLEKNAQDAKSGAGQYFTPRALIAVMVECINPQPTERVCDPACGTGGFLFSAHQHVVDHHPNLTKDEKKHLKESAFVGFELVQATARVCAMNLLLHGIGSEKSVPVRVGDALGADPGERFEVVLANPPFGKKSSTVIVGEDGRTSTEKDTIERAETWRVENPDGRWRAYSYDELTARDKTSLDIFWLKDDSLADSDKLPAPAVIAQEIVEDLQAALAQFKLIAGDLEAATGLQEA